MRLRDQVALTLPSFFLRLVLGITFLWAGTGKFMGTITVSGDDAARLANVGIMPTPIVDQPDPQSDPTTTQPLIPINPLPDPESQTEQKSNQQEDLENKAQELIDTIKDEIGELESPESETQQSEPALDPESDSLGMDFNQSAYQMVFVQDSSPNYAGSDFENPMEVNQLYSIALMITKASNPGLTPDSQPITPIMPSILGSGPWPKVLSWVTAIVEIVAGAFLLLGLATRLCAMSTFSVMLVATWMTQFGPSILQEKNAIFGFIPYQENIWAPGSYSILLWQLSIIAMSGAVFFLGSGSLGIDRILFRPRVRDPYIHGDPKAHRDSSVTQHQDRTEFDRTPNPTP